MSESVKVAVRCRPMSQKELQLGCRTALTVDSVAKTCTLESSSDNSGKVFQFDATFDPATTTERVYEDVGSVVVEAVLDGYNGTVFAYGQTGCGKSHTMQGVIERSLEHLFEATSTSSSSTRYLALLSYLEIYNERLRDLLQDSADADVHANLLQLKEDPVRGTYVSGGLREVTVKNVEECVSLLATGSRRRAAAATRMNATSSRSHGVLTLALEAIAITDQQKSSVRKGRLHLVDLAGSERQGRTGATGDRLKEAASINLSLSALGNVISALAAGQGRHVPYRDSKLTRLLRDSLGGNARTLMIACVSPSDLDADETLSTLRYAARARSIKNKPIVNEDPKDALLRQYQVELQRLRKLLESNDGPTTGIRDEGEDVQDMAKNEEKEVQESQKIVLMSDTEALTNDDEQDSHGVVKNKENLDRENEKRRRRREIARKDVMKRLERLTIGGEALGDAEARKRRERRRKRLEALVGALESNEDNEGAVQVYGQLKSTEEALRRAARRARQLEAEVADLQASWDAERRDLLRRELLTTQICEAMLPHLRPGCPFRDLDAVRAAATWCEELARWRLPDVRTSDIPLPPTSLAIHGQGLGQTSRDSRPITGPEPDHNNNNDDGDYANESKTQDIADTYFRRSRIDALLAHAREAKTLGIVGRQSRSGGSEDPSSGNSNHLQLSALNLQSSAPAAVANEPSFSPVLKRPIFAREETKNGWLHEENDSKWTSCSTAVLKKTPPRILEALPSYPLGGVKQSSRPSEVTSLSRLQGDHQRTNHLYFTHSRSPTY